VLAVHPAESLYHLLAQLHWRRHWFRVPTQDITKIYMDQFSTPVTTKIVPYLFSFNSHTTKKCSITIIEKLGMESLSGRIICPFLDLVPVCGRIL
jgi:hypothetical protein